MKKNILFICMLILLSGCDSFLDLQPIDYPVEDNFYSDAKGLEGALIGAYDELQSSDQYGAKFQTLMEMRGDNILNNNSGASGGITYQIEVFTETPANSNLSGAWLSLYNVIYRCNLILQNVETVKMTDDQRNKIAGQAAFIRALSYFNVVRLWGKAPLITKVQTVDEARNNKRAEVDVIYDQIIQDLEIAKKLPASWGDSEKGGVTSYAAQALLAKIYLYRGRYADVVSELSPVVEAIEKGVVLSLVPMNQTFPGNLKTSKDVIFAIQFLKGGVGESVHQNNRYRNNDNGNVISLEQSEFESGDIRKELVTPTGNGERPQKFNAPAENNETSGDFPVLRCAEVMLMYAEALNEISYPDANALAALNAVRVNAGLASKTAIDLNSKESFRQAVYKERHLELALECDRWFDIVRTNQFELIYSMIPAYRKLYPVPQEELENVYDPTGWQNEGYTL